MENLVYAELAGNIPFEMFQDKLVCIISDTGVFVVTTLENSHNYTEDFYPVDVESQKAYGLEYREGRVFQKQQNPVVSEPNFTPLSPKPTTTNSSGNLFHYVKK